jgi:hypothetical protein
MGATMRENDMIEMRIREIVESRLQEINRNWNNESLLDARIYLV